MRTACLAVQAALASTRIATLIRHPNVAALYDFSRMPDGSWYMVWEFIDGITLEEWMRRYPDFELSDPGLVTWSAGQVRGPRTLPVRILPSS